MKTEVKTIACWVEWQNRLEYFSYRSVQFDFIGWEENSLTLNFEKMLDESVPFFLLIKSMEFDDNFLSITFLI